MLFGNLVTKGYFCTKKKDMADIKAEYLACPIRQVVSRFGDKWSLLVLFLLNRSESGVMRFNEIFTDACTHCPDRLGQGTFQRSSDGLDASDT